MLLQEHSGEHGLLHFKNPYLKEVLATMIFHGPWDLGIRFNSLFACGAIPPRMLAFACAMVSINLGFLADNQLIAQ
jgi:hypothetical protein